MLEPRILGNSVKQLLLCVCCLPTKCNVWSIHVHQLHSTRGYEKQVA